MLAVSAVCMLAINALLSTCHFRSVPPGLRSNRRARVNGRMRGDVGQVRWRPTHDSSLRWLGSISYPGCNVFIHTIPPRSCKVGRHPGPVASLMTEDLSCVDISRHPAVCSVVWVMTMSDWPGCRGIAESISKARRGSKISPRCSVIVRSPRILSGRGLWDRRQRLEKLVIGKLRGPVVIRHLKRAVFVEHLPRATMSLHLATLGLRRTPASFWMGFIVGRFRILRVVQDDSVL